METLKAKKKNGQMDFLLYVTVLLLCAFGLVMVFSASYYYAQNKASLNYDGLYYLKNQAKYMAMGLGVMIVMSRVDYHYLEKLRNVGLMVTLLLMLAAVFWGEDINGAKRWLNLFDVITFQPSELAKFVLILYMASFMTRRAPQMKSFTRGIVPMLIIMCIICILLLLQKNMSMMMVVMMLVVVLIMVVIAGALAFGIVIAGAFMRLFALSLNKHPDRIANIVGILPYKFTNGICFKIAVIPFVVSIVLQVQRNNCSVGVLLCGFNCVAVKSFGLPLPCLVAAVCPTENGNLFADHERRIESNTKLADNIHIIFVELVVVFECKRAALGNCAKV